MGCCWGKKEKETDDPICYYRYSPYERQKIVRPIPRYPSAYEKIESVRIPEGYFT